MKNEKGVIKRGKRGKEGKEGERESACLGWKQKRREVEKKGKGKGVKVGSLGGRSS